jgi:uncharacterized protein YjbI with pentapeptide repeats
MKKQLIDLSSPARKPVLPVTLKNGQWQVAQTPTSGKAVQAVNPPQWFETPPPPGLLWIGTAGGTLTLLATSVGLLKSRLDIKAQHYKTLLEGGDQGPLAVLKASTQRSNNLTGQAIDLNTVDVQETSAQTNSALKTMKDAGLLATKAGIRVLAGNNLKLNHQVIENHNFNTRFHPLNKLKQVLYPKWWRQELRMEAARELTQKRLSQPGQHERWWFEVFKPPNWRTHLLGTAFDHSRLHNNQFNKADMSETTYRDGRLYQNDFVQTKLNRSVFDQVVAIFNNFSKARLQGSSAHNGTFVGLRANGIDARPYTDPPDLKNPEKTPKTHVTHFKGLNISKVGKLQKPEVWVRALSTMRKARLDQADWQGSTLDGLDLTRSVMDGGNVQDTTWKGTVHDLQNLRRVRLKPQPGRHVKFETSTTAPFRSKQAKKAHNQLETWEKEKAQIDNLPIGERLPLLTKLGPKPATVPKDFCTFKKSDLSGRDMSGVEIGGVLFKKAKLSSTYLGESTIDGHKVMEIVTNPEVYQKQWKQLKEILTDVVYERNKPPILTYRFDLPNLPQEISLKSNRQLLQEREQNLVKSRLDMLKKVQDYTDIPQG